MLPVLPHATISDKSSSTMLLPLLTTVELMQMTLNIDEPEQTSTSNPNATPRPLIITILSAVCCIYDHINT